MVDDDGNEIPPMAFIPAAERYSSMPMIDSWVIKEAMRVCQDVMWQPSVTQHCLFAVNLSGTHR